MRIANTVNDSIVDGPGLRFTIFTQGCFHHCPACHNPATHDPAGGEEVRVEDLIAQIGTNPLIQGVTLSGGEPFLQAADCARLAVAAHEKDLDVWTYSGYTYEQLTEAENPDWDALLAETDVLVDGPFVLAKKSYEARFRGSTNQRLIDVKRSRQAGRAVLWSDPDQLAHFTVPES